MNSPHDSHLTKLAELALRLPGTWAWRLVLRLGLATTPCKRPWECKL